MMIQENRSACGSRKTALETADARRPAFGLLVDRGILSKTDLQLLVEESKGSPKQLEESLTARNVPRDEMLSCLRECYGLPSVEFDESVRASADVLQRVDLERLKEELWLPLAARKDEVDVIACNPSDPVLRAEIERTFDVPAVNFRIGLPSDIVRLIEHHQDINPGFPASAGRTILARLRTWLAEERTVMAWYRTSLAKARTGLAFMRTGISLITIGLVLLRIFGIGYLSILEGLVLIVGAVMAVDGFTWYYPIRKLKQPHVRYDGKSEPTFGTTFLTLMDTEDGPVLRRSQPIPRAGALRGRWNRLTPVMKRRFLAIDRTDFAEERTILANFRSIMARARTGLAFTRTGVALVGLGIALVRQFGFGPWIIFDGALIAIGIAMVLEGVRWYPSGRQAGQESSLAIEKIEKKFSIWDFMFRPFTEHTRPDDLPPVLAVKGTYAPGIWGTTGLALERTLVAERRNVKARYRTTLARSRTGMAFMRTGSSIFSVGLGLLVFFGFGSIGWIVFNNVLMVVGAILLVDGLYWHIPAEKAKREFPFCTSDIEIDMPDYARPVSAWRKAAFSHEDL